MTWWLLAASVLIPLTFTYALFRWTQGALALAQDQNKACPPADPMFYIVLQLFMPGMFIWIFWVMVVVHYSTENWK